MKTRHEIMVKVKVYNQMLEDFEDPEIPDNIFQQVLDRVSAFHWVLGG